MTKTVVNVLAINLDTLSFRFISTEEAVNYSQAGVLLVRVAEDLEALSGPQSVALFNAAIGPHQAPVKRFSDKTAAAKRLWAVFQDLAIKAQFEADEKAAGAVVEERPLSTPIVATVVLPEAVEPKAKIVPAPAKTKDKTSRRGTGVNLSPQKKVYPCRAGTKQAKLVDLLSRPQGATFKELHAAMTSPEFARLKPWTEITTRSSLGWDVHAIKGYGIRTTKRENGEDCYRLTYPAGMNSPLPHTPRKTGVDLVEQIQTWARENYNKSYGASALIETKTADELRAEFKTLAEAKRWAKLASEMYQNAQG